MGGGFESLRRKQRLQGVIAGQAARRDWCRLGSAVILLLLLLLLPLGQLGGRSGCGTQQVDRVRREGLVVALGDAIARGHDHPLVAHLLQLLGPVQSSTRRRFSVRVVARVEPVGIDLV